MIEERIIEAAYRLNDALTRMNVRITEIETALRELKLGVRAILPMGAEEFLIFGKHNNVWRLLYQNGDEKAVPLVNAIKDVRLRSIPILLSFPEQLLICAEEEIEKVEAAVVKCKWFVGELRK